MLYTASAIISFHGRLEEKTQTFYENLIDDKRCTEVRDTFAAFIKENQNHKERILRSYQEVITDALEAAFPKKYLDEKHYEIDTVIKEDLKFPQIIRKAIDIEDKCYTFCQDAGESFSDLLADIPEAFMWVAKRKTRRKEKLEFFYTPK